MKKYESCYASSPKALAQIEKNFQSGAQLGVSGTPAFFINGRRLSGAIPYDQFAKIIDEELAKLKVKS